MVVATNIERDRAMNQITTIGLDLAKKIFQVHGIDADGRAVVRRALRRGEVLKFFSGLRPCLVGIEACATAHHWGRKLGKLGHTVRLMPPAYVKGVRTRAVQNHALGGQIKNKDSELGQLCNIHSKRSTKPRFVIYPNLRNALTYFLSAGF
jgi:hypothetical protein